MVSTTEARRMWQVPKLNDGDPFNARGGEEQEHALQGPRINGTT